MNIKENPFFLLNATLRNTKAELSELEEEFSLFNDSDRDLLSEVVSPRLRVQSELGWLIGVTEPTVLRELANKSLNDLVDLRHLHALDQLNLISSSLSLYKGECHKLVKDSILRLADLFEGLYLRLDEVMVLLNQERKYSGFPLLSDTSQLEDGVNLRKDYFNQSIKDSLDRLDSQTLVSLVTDIVDENSMSGVRQCYTLVQDLVDYYEVATKHVLSEETASIELLIENIMTITTSQYSNDHLDQLISKLITRLRGWDTIAQPIQVSFQGKGLEHEESKELAYKVRNLSLYMFNEKFEDGVTKKLSEVSLELFGEVTSISKRLEKDIEDIEEIEFERKQRAEEEAIEERKRDREMAYYAEIGIAFKDELKINSSGISWKGDFVRFEDIIFYRYQAIRGNLTTDYIFEYGSDKCTYKITTKKQVHFSALLDRLWKGIGYRLMINFAVDIACQAKNSFSGIGVRDNGLVLYRKKFLRASEPVLVPWNRLTSNTYNGQCTYSLVGDNKVSASLDVSAANYHMFSTLVSIMIDKRASRLSEVFGVN
ncbi:hypothetical protein [Vibrio hyugaensis]|uniref:hypothetical protein n=1 Tax=Vibrio hyugaensis TaxID=1534743 RepID=UPI0005ED92B3|nr:hypothetical protein [Vibrio hyugaensis]